MYIYLDFAETLGVVLPGKLYLKKKLRIVLGQELYIVEVSEGTLDGSG